MFAVLFIYFFNDDLLLPVLVFFFTQGLQTERLNHSVIFLYFGAEPNETQSQFCGVRWACLFC